MTEVAITVLPAAPLHALEIWSNAPEFSQRFEAAFGARLPAPGSSLQLADSLLIRFEPTVWLAITRKFCELLKGDVTVASERGKGSTFTVRIPQTVEK